MGENTTSILPDVIKPISDAVQQNIPETAKQTDGVLSTVVGFFNNVVLFPVKRANLTFRYKLEVFEDDLKDKLKDVPEENLQIPSTMIAGPTLEALRYAYDEDDLREMYENLLASAMDNRKSTKTHPAFVDAIRQMSPLDAQVLNKLVNIDNWVRCGEIQFKIKSTTKVYVDAMPNYFVEELYDLADPFAISSSLVNLTRLALIKITEGGLTGADYNSMKMHPYVKTREELFKSFGREFEIIISKHAVIITNYGEQFTEVCLGKDN